MSTTDATMRDAISWYVRQNDLDAAGWSAFTDWLERDPAHAQAYDRLCLDDATTAPIAPEMRRADTVARPVWGRRRRWGVMGGGLAAAAALALTIGLPRPATPPTLYAAGGAPRTLALAGGLNIDLAPGSRLSMASDDGRTATLAAGTALFKVRHDPAHPFEVRVGDHVIRDVGTVFQISVTRAGLDVTVSEGEVQVDPDGNGWRVTAGRRLTIDQKHAEARFEPASAAELGAWRLGHLDLVGVPFGSAVAALGHADGVDAHITPDLSSRRFTGNVKLTGDAARDMARFAELTGTVAKPDGDGWVIAPEEGAR
ncbi:FecR family protein [Sphingomonas sp. GlSt437]|uniref:FecR family protein n=1 Tax=Sphingomonas sp. GlSt437 TaxID=3389970 RepID=UPI003A87D5EE